MSHTVTIKTKITDLTAIQAASNRLKLPQPTQGEVRLFDRVASGIGIQLRVKTTLPPATQPCRGCALSPGHRPGL